MDRESLAGRISRHRVVVFVALAYALTWSITLPLALEAHGLLPFPLTYKLHYLGQFGPMLAALAVIRLTAGTAGLADIVARATRWRVGVVWWLAALSPIL